VSWTVDCRRGPAGAAQAIVGVFGAERKNFQSLMGWMCQYVGFLQLQCRQARRQQVAGMVVAIA
jgi:hypothetical protein